MKFQNVHTVYFLGIGGIGMSALARWFAAQGKAVAGYDRTRTALTERLEGEGIGVTYTDAVEALPEAVRTDKEHTLVVRTPAVPADHAQWQWLQAQGYTIQKRSQVLGIITQGFYTVAVAGTHGKTTTSSMVAHLLHACGRDVAAFLGGIAANFDSNLVMNHTADPTVVVEADEFDRSFLTLHPNVAVVTAADADHLDIYGDASALHDSFRQFVGQLADGGTLLVQAHTAEVLGLAGQRYEQVSYGRDAGTLQAQNVQAAGDQFTFTLVRQGQELGHFTLPMPGFHNVENAVAALGVALRLGVGIPALQQALASYRGVKRRFEYVYRGEGQVYIDDYAHHPTEIAALLHSVRALYPGQPITAIFQPHLYSRTRDFAPGFSESLSLADEVILLPIYPARELPLPGVDSGMLLEAITAPQKRLIPKERLLEVIQEKHRPVLLTVGAGDIDQWVQPIKTVLEP